MSKYRLHQKIVCINNNIFYYQETAALEAEAFELKQKVAAAAEIKSVLDSWVRYEAAIREREQKALAEAVIEKVKATISDPKVVR